MKSHWRLALGLALAMSFLAIPVQGIPLQATVAAGEGSPSYPDLPVLVTETGEGPVALVLIAGGKASASCLDRVAEAMESRYRVIRISLDESIIEGFGGPDGTAQALAKALGEKNLRYAFVVGCESAAGIIGGVAYRLPAIQGAALIGNPASKAILPVHVSYIASNVGPAELAGIVGGEMPKSWKAVPRGSRDLVQRKGNTQL